MAQQAQLPGWYQGLVEALNNNRARKPIRAPVYDGTTDVQKFLQTFGEVSDLSLIHI